MAATPTGKQLPAYWSPNWAAFRAAPLRWTKKREEAALQVATFVPIEQTASELGISVSTMRLWMGHPQFKERVESIREEIRSQVINLRIADVAERVRILDGLQAGYLKVIEERAQDLDGEVAGGGTGLLARTERAVSLGKGNYTTEVEYKADTAITTEIMKLQEQAAKELGQRVDKKELTANIGIRREFVVVDNSDDPPLTEAELQSLPDPDVYDAEFEEL